MNTALQKRIITAAILIPLVVTAILWLPSRAVSFLFGGLVLAGAWEWAALAGLTSNTQRLFYLGLVFFGLVAVYLLPVQWVVITASCWWVLALFLVVRYPNIRLVSLNSMYIKGLVGMLVLLPAWKALVSLLENMEHGAYVVLFLLVLMWVADSGAYFAGRRFGRTKLAPRVSPGKTWEGVAGAVALSAAYAFIYPWLSHMKGEQWGIFLALCMVTVIFSIVGDLLESLIKREAGAKDSGSLLPGHGGVLDRIDSLTAAAPIFVLGMWMTGQLV